METTVGTSWSLGTLIGFPIGILCVLICTYLVYLSWRFFQREAKKRERNIREDRIYSSDDRTSAIWAVAGSVALTLCAIAATAAAMYPFKAEYHQWRPVSGTITHAEDRFNSDGSGGTEQSFVYVINDHTYRCDDSRCALLDEGDSVELLCKPEFQYASTDPYVCKFVRSEVSR